jgi:hypothetical protein
MCNGNVIFLVFSMRSYPVRTPWRYRSASISAYPVRVVDPPTYPNEGNAVCRWTVYRRPEYVPESVYTRLGLQKPPAGAELGSAGFPSRARGKTSL